MARIRPRALMFRCVGSDGVEFIVPESRYIEERRAEQWILLADERWLRDQAIDDVRHDDEQGRR